MTDQRVDPATRSRLDELEDRYIAAIRGVVLGLAIMALATTAALVWTASVDRDQDESRREAITRICESQNRLTRGIHAFIRVRAPDALELAGSNFPLVDDCRAYARELVERD